MTQESSSTQSQTKDVTKIQIESSDHNFERRPFRTQVVCQPCATAKLRCDKQRPCGRCRRIQTPELCLDRKKRPPGSRKRKSPCLRTGLQACIQCSKRKIACDSSRPCGPCRERQHTGGGCTDVASIFDLSYFIRNSIKSLPVSSFMNLNVVRRIWRYGYLRFSPLTLYDFFQSKRVPAFVNCCLLHMDEKETGILLKEIIAAVSPFLTNSIEEKCLDLRRFCMSFHVESVPALEGKYAIIRFAESIAGNRQMVMIHMNEYAQQLWGYTSEDLQSACVEANGNMLSIILFLWNLWHISCWPSIAQSFFTAWIRGTIEVKLPLCAIRRDKTIVTVHTRWFFIAGEDGIWKNIAIHARLIRGK